MVCFGGSEDPGEAALRRSISLKHRTHILQLLWTAGGPRDAGSSRPRKTVKENEVLPLHACR